MSLLPAVTAEPWQAAAERAEIRDQSRSGTAVSARGEQDRDLGLEPWPQTHSTAGAVPGVTPFLCAGVWFLHTHAGVSGEYAHVCVCRGCRGRFGDILPGLLLLSLCGSCGPTWSLPAHPFWSRHYHPSCLLERGISGWCSSSPVPALPCPFLMGRARAVGHGHG